MNLLSKVNKKIATLFIVVACVSMSVSMAFAEGVANASVTGAFTTLKDDVIATLGVIGGLAVAVMAIFMAWKYGRKIFNQVAK
jgi:uncharacterized membrane protein